MAGNQINEEVCSSSNIMRHCRREKKRLFGEHTPAVVPVGDSSGVGRRIDPGLTDLTRRNKAMEEPRGRRPRCFDGDDVEERCIEYGEQCISIQISKENNNTTRTCLVWICLVEGISAESGYHWISLHIWKGMERIFSWKYVYL